MMGEFAWMVYDNNGMNAFTTKKGLLDYIFNENAVYGTSQNDLSRTAVSNDLSNNYQISGVYIRTGSDVEYEFIAQKGYLVKRGERLEW